MTTECNQLAFDFHPLGGRRVTAAFDGGTITSDGGALLLRELESRSGLLASLAQCFDDHRDPELVEHTVEELLKQRVFALALVCSLYQRLLSWNSLGKKFCLRLRSRRQKIAPSGRPQIDCPVA